MGAADNLVTNISKVKYTSFFPTDQIIGSLTGSFPIAAGSPSTNAFVVLDTGFGDTCLTMGFYSLDGGTTWIPINHSYLNGTDPVTGQLSLTTFVDSATDGLISISATNTTKSAYTIQYKVLLLAKPNQGRITPLPVGEKSAYQFTGNNNYMKVFKQDVITLAPSTSVTITHGLGYIPNFILWSSSDYVTFGDNLALTLASTRRSIIDSNSLTITNNDTTYARSFIYRIYYGS